MVLLLFRPTPLSPTDASFLGLVVRIWCSSHCLPLAKSSQMSTDEIAWEMQPSGVCPFDIEQDRDRAGQPSLGHTQAVCPGQSPGAVQLADKEWDCPIDRQRHAGWRFFPNVRWLHFQ